MNVRVAIRGQGKDYRERVQCQWKSRKRGRKRNLGREESEVYTLMSGKLSSISPIQ